MHDKINVYTLLRYSCGIFMIHTVHTSICSAWLHNYDSKVCNEKLIMKKWYVEAELIIEVVPVHDPNLVTTYTCQSMIPMQVHHLITLHS